MMRNKIINNYLDVKLVTYLSLAISILLHTAMMLSFWFGEGIIFQQIADHKKHPLRFDALALNVLFTFILAFVLYLYNMYIQKKEELNKNSKLTLIILGSIIITILMSFVFTTLHPHILGYNNKLPINKLVHIYRNGLMRDFFVTMVVTLSWQLLIANYQSRKIAVENEALIAENLRSRYEALKNQMNPHFLFNSLNTLQSLISIDAKKAENYIQELAKVLRYSLQNYDVVSLQDELKLVNSYCNLMKIRYGNNINFVFEINNDFLNYEILPLSLQVLIENAIKHNIISEKQPLSIVIRTDEDNSIVVSNKIQPKLDASNGNGIGLTNLAERYRLKWNNDIIIENNDNIFAVIIQLNKQ